MGWVFWAWALSTTRKCRGIRRQTEQGQGVQDKVIQDQPRVHSSCGQRVPRARFERRGVRVVRAVWSAGWRVTVAGRLQLCRPVESLLSPHPGLTEEPVLWSFVSKEPPAPADGTPGAAHDRGLSLNWAVPNVLVKDVPDFEQLSPELEAGTAPLIPSMPTFQVPCMWGAWGWGPHLEGARGLQEDRAQACHAWCPLLLHIAPFTPHHNPSGPECFSLPISLMRKLKLREGKGLAKVSGPTTGGFEPKSVPEKARSLPTAQGRAEGASPGGDRLISPPPHRPPQIL